MLPQLPYTLEISEWETPATFYFENTVGTARIRRKNQGRGYYPLWGVDGYLFYRVKKPIPVTSLEILEGRSWKTWMVDDPPQWRSMQIFAENATGQVLTTGLGLGLVLHALAENRQVSRIVAVERNRDVIALMQENIPPQVEIVEGDFYDFIARDTTLWDTIIVDLWVSSSVKQKMLLLGEVFPLAAYLKRRYPKASISFHGFVTLSDIQVVSNPMMKLIQELKPYGP